MTIKNVLVAYTGHDSSMSALRHAIKIADHHDGWLTAVLGYGQPPMERRMATHLPRDMLVSLREFDRKQIEEARTVFEAAVVEHGRSDKASFVDLDVEHGAPLADFARTFDLVVMGMHRPGSADTHMAANPDLMALHSGRPVLVVPRNFDAPGLAENMLLAWDGKRAAARAVGDAMPLLRERGRVTVLTIGSKPAPGTDQLIANLRHHDVDARHVHQPKTRSVGRMILETADSEGAKAIVMGAFEHSKFSQDLWGGVTTDVMRDAHVPLFMSH
ncbi:universal stress protein [Primorskyibacter flagellatus]|uniref:universal stress protein n=1 Tax=Primorskyibacter flagellatus TaxID=1387277 RepID=UPI003A8CC35D